MTQANIWQKIELIQGDITKLNVDAIVNAANNRLAGGGGVDGAIHRAAGATELQAACREFDGCDTGDAVLTPGFKLAARSIIHTVGPVYRDGAHGEPVLLASCYCRSLEVAVDNGCRTVAFPAISTGVYGYPFESATEIAIATIAGFLRENPAIEKVILVFFGEEDYAQAQRILERMVSN